MPQHNLTLGAVALVAMSTAACSVHYADTVPHPAHNGVQRNSIELRRASAEEPFELPPGSLSHHAALVGFDASSICFNVVMRSTASDPALADPTRVDWQLVAKPGQTYEAERYGEQRDRVADKLPGTTLRTTRVTERVCEERPVTVPDAKGKTKRQVLCRDREVVRQVRVATDITVLEGAGLVCFDHGGRIDARTDEVTLRYHRGLGTYRGFTWDFE